MVRRFPIGISVVVVVITLAALRFFAPGVRGSGVLKTETLEVDRFDHLELEGVGTARIAIGEPQLLQMTTDENLLPLLSINVEEGNLTIRSVEEIRPSELLVTIRVQDLRGVALAGNPEIQVPHVVRESFDIAIRGHGTADVSGQTDHLTVRILGNGLVRAGGLVARRAEVEISGAGGVEVHAIEELTVTCLGSGNVRHFGEPKLTIHGDCSVERMTTIGGRRR